MNCARMLTVMVLAACVGCSGELRSPTQPTVFSRVTIAEVNANRDAYVGQGIEVEGRIDVEPITGTLHIVVPGEVRTSSNSLVLYEVAPNGLYVPASCRVTPDAAFDCGALTKDAVMTIDGSFIKIEQPTGDSRLGVGPGQVRLVTYLYFLLVKH